MKKGDFVKTKKGSGIVVDFVETDKGLLYQVELETAEGPEIITILQTSITVISLIKELATGVVDLFKRLFGRKKKREIILKSKK